MVRSLGIAAVVLGLAWAGLAEAQTSSPPQTAPPRQRYITVREEGKPPQRCKLVKTWHEPNGVPAFQVQAVDSGEVMTIVGSGPPAEGGDPRAMSTRIYRWGSANKPPAGAPQPPSTARTMAAPLAQPASPKATPVVTTPTIRPAPRPSAPTQSATAPRPTPAIPTARKPVIAPVPTIRPAPQVVTTPTIRPAPRPSAPTQSATAPRPTPAIPTARKPVVAPVPTVALPAPAQPTPTPPAVTIDKPASSTGTPPPKPFVAVKPRSLTPMSTQVIQQPIVRKPEMHDSTPSTPPQPRLVPSAGGTVVGQTPGNCGCPTPCDACSQPCNPCCQPSCVCCTPSPMRQSFISRLFKSQRGCDCANVVCQPEPAAAPAPNPAAATLPAPAVAKVATEPAKPRDWRESWGKVEPWKERKDTAQAAPAKPMEIVTERAAPAPVILETPKEPDPLKNPDLYREMAMNARPANSKIPQENQPSASSGPRFRLFGAKPPAPQPDVAAAPPASAGEKPNGRSPGRSVQLSANEANAFWSPPEPPAPSKEPKPKFNAFDRDENSPPPQGGPPRMVAGYTGPLPPPGPMPRVRQTGSLMMPSRPDMGVPDALGNAFTLPGTRRPIPADFGGTPQEPNGFDPAVQMGQGSPPQGYSMAMSRPPMAVNPFMNVPATPVAPNQVVAAARPAAVPQLLGTLKDSLYPSERESAAEQLSELSWRGQPQVVAGLMKSAHDDPAATVRAACVHALAHMKVGTTEAMAVVRGLKSDRDPRVRQEAEEALNALGDSGIQQASHR